MLTTIGGEFADRAQERAFRAATLAEARHHARLAVALSAGAFALFVPLDLMAPGNPWPVWLVTGSRGLLLAVALLVLLRLPAAESPERLDRLQLAFLGTYVLAAGLVFHIAADHVALGAVARDSMVFNWASITLLLLLSWLIFPLRFAAAAAVSLAAMAVLVAASLAPFGPPGAAGIGQGMLAALASSFGALLARHLNRMRRRNFATLTALGASEEALRKLFMAVPVPLGLSRMTDGRLLKANAAGLAAFGYTAEQALGQSAERLYADPVRRHELIDLLRRDGVVQSFECDMRLADGSCRTFLLSASLLEYHGEDCLMVGATDISQRKEMEGELMRLASTDPLTGLANRHHFFSLSPALMARARRFGESLTVLMLDLDHFKAINDAHGHDVGDLVLIAFAQMCRAIFRESDVVARIGGEEFAVLLPATDLTGGLQVAERLRDAVAGHHIVPASGRPLHVTVSIGAAELEPTDATIDDALMRADRALYHAKRSGRNCVGGLGGEQAQMMA